jgi:UDP-N-acetylmuramyl-tripeptide synthetase
MVLVGVTGTNGKTTTTHLIRTGLAARGEKAGVIGTVGYAFEGEETPAPHTTPEAPELSRLLRRWRDRGATAVAMEVSSHALSLERTYGVAFDAGVFTNLTQDHLDFHETMETYREAKSRLFRAEARGDRTKTFTGVVNMDDEAGRWIRDHGDPPFLSYGVRSAAEVTAEDVRFDPAGTRLRVRTVHGRFPVALRLRGAFNVENALAAFAGLIAVGTEPRTAALALGTVASVPGRLEPVEAGQPFQVLVDYAPPPDALSRALDAVRVTKPRRLLCVFGCGGDRDRERGRSWARPPCAGRPGLHHLGQSQSEDPSAIVAEIEAGARGGAPTRVIVDRQEAIEAAVNEAGENDALLIAGKGHETYQILGNRTIPFDDRAVARGALQARGYRS